MADDELESNLENLEDKLPVEESFEEPVTADESTSSEPENLDEAVEAALDTPEAAATQEDDETVESGEIEASEAIETAQETTESSEDAEEETVGIAPEEAFQGSYGGTATAQPTKWPGQWYVLHTYSGYEDAVAEALKQRIESLDMQDKIFDVMVPKENQIEIKGGKRKIVEKKMFPGYVLVNMTVTHDSWFVVRNTPNVTGFIGTDTDPVPVDESEIKAIFKRVAVEEPKYNIDLSIGDLVHIKDGPFKNYDGSVSEVDEERGKIKVLVSIFGRETPVELDFLQVQKV